MLWGYCPLGLVNFEALYNLTLEKSQLLLCYLHNFLRNKSKHYLRAGSVDWKDANREIHSADLREEQHLIESLRTCRSRNIGAVVRSVRDSYRQNFCTQGQVPWQGARIA
ncbi:hypothetical protein RRG08_009338 [Elysia crispata]|uniref:Uncharacterized protein n=1 Tax=Elysia crispata TaxID=231223 RepID=A0AAE0Y5G9_9GAST|nr:hypothetical protein RRG08_009338 [Elysia crispata]